MISILFTFLQIITESVLEKCLMFSCAAFVVRLSPSFHVKGLSQQHLTALVSCTDSLTIAFLTQVLPPGIALS